MNSQILQLANELERIFRNSEEYTSLKKLLQEIYSDPVAKQLFDQFNRFQIQIQRKQMMGQQITNVEKEQLNQMLSMIQQNKKIVNLLEADQRANTLLMDISNIITKPMEEIYGKLDIENVNR